MCLSWSQFLACSCQEREERRMRLKRDRPDDRNMHDQFFQARRFKSYEKNKLPPGMLFNFLIVLN